MMAHEPWWNREWDEAWHLVRHPYDCIASMATRLPTRFWTWQIQYTGLHPQMFRSRREFASHFWVKWNDEAEDRDPVFRVKIEDFEAQWPDIWGRLGFSEVPLLDPRSENYKGKGRDDAAEKAEPLTKEEILSWSPTLFDAIGRKAEKYGYEL